MTSPSASPPWLTVRVRRVTGAPVVAVRVWLVGGSRLESAPGQALAAGRLLAEGTRRRGWQRIAEEAEERGLSISTAAGTEAQSLALDGLASDWRLALEWAAELSLEAVFPADRCRWIADQTRAELESLADHPDVVAEWAFRRQLYGSHPRGRPLQGTLAALDSLDCEGCRDHHRRAVARGVIVAVAGAVEPSAVEGLTQELFEAGAPRVAGEERVEPPSIVGDATRREVALARGEQAHLLVGGLTVRRNDPLLAALDLLAVVLGSGGGLVGRIPRRVREVEGLSYACRVATNAGAGLDPGRCELYIATAREQVERAERVIRQELEELIAAPLPVDELEEARSFLLGREPFRRETARQWADLLAEAAFYGLPLDRPEWVRQQIRAVTTRDVEAAARRFLDPGKLSTTVAARR